MSIGDQICTSPIMHLLCPENIVWSPFSVSPGKTAIPRRNWKDGYAKLWGKTRCIMGDVQMANRPFYRYGGHTELITFKEYYGMPRGHELDPIYSFCIYARFSVLNSKRKKKQLKLWTLRRNWYGLLLYFFSRKRRSLLHPNTVQSSFFPLKSYSWKTLRKNCPEKLA